MDRSFLLGWVVAFLIFMVLVIVQKMFNFSDANAPAWVQAIGSILAIIAATLLPIWHEDIRAKQRKAETFFALKCDGETVIRQMEDAVRILQTSEGTICPEIEFLSKNLLSSGNVTEKNLVEFIMGVSRWVNSMNKIIGVFNHNGGKLNIPKDHIASYVANINLNKETMKNIFGSEFEEHHTAPPSA